ncbi:glycoside hydrolase [bacterium]|nr:glycoside hydrolase [bacterium]
MNPIYLNLMWHQHQPYYREGRSNRMMLPWVRLHALKDYYDMAAILANYPRIHQTFNLVPSMLDQLEGYVRGEYTDRYLEPSRKPVSEWSAAEKRFVVERFFDASPRMLESMPRYMELQRMRGPGPVTDEVVRRFSPQDLLDLVVCFNLVWIDPLWRERDGDICQTLFRIGREFTEKQKQRLLTRQREIMAEVIPIHKQLQDAGQIEVTFSPYFHPILPLLIDNECAREAMPEAELPEPVFRHPEDAEAQIALGMAAYRRWFGRDPAGMWPSEGSVSAALVPILSKLGVAWIATDEEILAHSRKKPLTRHVDDTLAEPEALYRPYRLAGGKKPVYAIFRDRLLSDHIGFHYANMDAEHAAHDFMHHLGRIHEQLGEKSEKYLVSVILDGENCWEWYPRDGHDFLAALYSRLSSAPHVRCVTVSEFLAENPPQKELKRLFAGSWIDHNFYIWIGHELDRRAWSLLSRAREALAEVEKSGALPPERLEEARWELYAAEGSDWFWWYGDDHTSEHDELFDRLFRGHLETLYELLGLPAPEEVFQPLGVAPEGRLARPPKGPISPILDGRESDLFEWDGAGYYDVRAHSGAMHHASEILRRIHYGGDERNFYLRLDTTKPPAECLAGGCRFQLRTEGPEARFVTTEPARGPGASSVVAASDMRELLSVSEGFVAGEIIEWAVAWEALAVPPGGKLAWSLALLERDAPVGVYPAAGALEVTRPSAESE